MDIQTAIQTYGDLFIGEGKLFANAAEVRKCIEQANNGDDLAQLKASHLFGDRFPVHSVTRSESKRRNPQFPAVPSIYTNAGHLHRDYSFIEASGDDSGWTADQSIYNTSWSMDESQASFWRISAQRNGVVSHDVLTMKDETGLVRYQMRAFLMPPVGNITKGLPYYVTGNDAADRAHLYGHNYAVIGSPFFPVRTPEIGETEKAIPLLMQYTHLCSPHFARTLSEYYAAPRERGYKSGFFSSKEYFQNNPLHNQPKAQYWAEAASHFSGKTPSVSRNVFLKKFTNGNPLVLYGAGFALVHGPMNDPELGIAYLEEAASKGDSFAARELGEIYEKRDPAYAPSIEQNLRKAYLWYAKAGELGHPNGTCRAALLVKKDPALANPVETAEQKPLFGKDAFSRDEVPKQQRR